MLIASDLSKTFGPQTLFTGCNLLLQKGNRYGIVGANGSGKSTLLRVLAGQEEASSGQVGVPRNARLGVLDQDHFKYEDVPILDVVMMGHAQLWRAIKEKAVLLANAAEHFDEARYIELEDIVLGSDGYGLEARAAQILDGLGIPSQQHQEPMRVLSGGYKLRALLGQTLCAEPDALLLDEPTNHLDILAIRWLEGFLQRYTGCAVVVSHDIRFLDRVCTHILDIDYERVTQYTGNYERFSKLKREERERQEREIKRREEEIVAQKASIARFKAKATKARQANSRQRRIEKIKLEPLPPSSRREPAFQFKSRRRSGRVVLTARGITRSYGDNLVLNDVSFEVQRGDRLAIIGPNGIGKSTLLKALVGELRVDAGEVEWGYESDFGYFPQDHHEALGNPEQAVKSSLWEACPAEGLGNVMGRLAAMLFSRDDVDKLVKNLSGGEAARLLFARLAAVEPTVLVLDEPTNHLDIESIFALAAALKKYDGTIIFVSHDRWFVERLATRIIELGPATLTDYHGGYRDYVRRGSTDHLNHEAVLAEAKAKKRAAKAERVKGDAPAEALADRDAVGQASTVQASTVQAPTGPASTVQAQRGRAKGRGRPAPRPASKATPPTEVDDATGVAAKRRRRRRRRRSPDAGAAGE